MVSPGKNLFFFRRLTALTVFLLLFFALVVFRLVKLQIIQGKKSRQTAENQHSIYKKLLPSRGEITLVDKYSSATSPVATNIKAYLVYAVPKEILNPSATAKNLASVLSLDPKDILGKISNTDKKYVPLKKQLTEDQQQQIKNLD